MLRIAAEFSFHGADPTVGRMRLIAHARIFHAALHDKILHNAMEGCSVVPARGSELEEVPHVFRRPIRLHFDLHGSEGSFERDRFAHLLDGRIYERLDLLFVERKFQNTNRFFGNIAFAGGLLRDLFHHGHAFGNQPEGGELSIQHGLRRNADEELAAIAIWLVRDADGGYDAALVFHRVVFRGKEIQAAGTPEVFRRLGILKERVAALNDAVLDDSMKGASVVVALPRELHEVLDVLGRVGGEFKPECAEFGFDYGFECGWRRLREEDLRGDCCNKK